MAGFNYNDSLTGGVSGSIEASSSLNALMFGVTGSLLGTSSWTEKVTITEALTSANSVFELNGEFITIPEVVWNASITSANNNILTLGRQSSGKIILAGAFSNLNGTSINRIARVNLDGTLDTTFNPGTGFNNSVNSIFITPDDKIACTGDFTTFNGVTVNGITRLTKDGTLDTSFLTGAGNADVKANGFSTAAGTAAAQSNTIIRSLNGGYIVVGSFDNYSGSYNPDNGGSYRKIIGLNYDGTIDTTFNVNQGNATTANRGFGALGIPSDIKIHNGGYVINGDLRRYTGTAFTTNTFLCRINANGSIDGTFNRPVADGSPNPEPFDTIAIDSNNNIYTSVGSTTYLTNYKVAKFTSNGTHVPTFNTTTLVGSTVQSVGLQSDGKVLVSGVISQYNSTNIQNILRVDGTTGALDSSFIYDEYGATGGVNISCRTVFPFEVQTPTQVYKQIIISGPFSTVNGIPSNGFSMLDQYGGNIGYLESKDSFPYIGTARITGSLNVLGSTTSNTFYYEQINSNSPIWDPDNGDPTPVPTPYIQLPFFDDNNAGIGIEQISPYNTTAVPLGAMVMNIDSSQIYVKKTQPGDDPNHWKVI